MLGIELPRLDALRARRPKRLPTVLAPEEVSRFLDSVRGNPQLCRLMFREVRSGPDYPGSRLHGLNRRYTKLLMDTIANVGVGTRGTSRKR